MGALYFPEVLGRPEKYFGTASIGLPCNFFSTRTCYKTGHGPSSSPFLRPHPLWESRVLSLATCSSSQELDSALSFSLPSASLLSKRQPTEKKPFQKDVVPDPPGLYEPGKVLLQIFLAELEIQDRLTNTHLFLLNAGSCPGPPRNRPRTYLLLNEKGSSPNLCLHLRYKGLVTPKKTRQGM